MNDCFVQLSIILNNFKKVTNVKKDKMTKNLICKCFDYWKFTDVEAHIIPHLHEANLTWPPDDTINDATEFQ